MGAIAIRIRLRRGQVDQRYEIGAGPVTSGVADDPDDDEFGRVDTGPGLPETLADGITAGQEAACERLADDRGRRRAGAILGGQQPAAQERYPQRGEVAGAHRLEARAADEIAASRRLARDGHGALPAAAQGELVGDRGRRDARDRRDAALDLLE